MLLRCSGQSQTQDLFRTIVGFANQEGGCVVGGVSEKGSAGATVQGVTLTSKRRDDLLHGFAQKMYGNTLLAVCATVGFCCVLSLTPLESAMHLLRGHFDVAACSPGAALGCGSFYHITFIPVVDEHDTIIPDCFVVLAHVRPPSNLTMVVLRDPSLARKRPVRVALCRVFIHQAERALSGSPPFIRTTQTTQLETRPLQRQWRPTHCYV